MSKNNNDMNNLKAQYLKTEVPKNINKNIDDLLNNLPKGNKIKINKSRPRIAVIAALILLLITVTLSFEPVRAAILSVLRQFDFKVETYEEINKTVVSGDDRIEINEAIFTEHGLIFTFTLDKEAFNNSDDTDAIYKEISIDLYNGLDISSININGSRVDIKDVDGACMINEATEKIIGYQRILFNDLKNGDKLQVKAKKKSMEDYFIIDFDVNINEEANQSFVLKDKIVKSDENGAIVVEELLVTPTVTYIVYTIEIAEELKGSYRLGVDFVNEYGRSMYRASSMADKEEIISDTKIRYKKYLFNSESGVEEINIIPWVTENRKGIGNNGVFVDLNIEKPYVINYGSFGTVTVNSVEETTDKILLNCDLKGINIDFLLNNINIAPSKSEEILNNTDIISNFNPIWTESYNEFQNLEKIDNYTLIFNKYEDIDEYSIFYREINNIDILDDLVIKINIK